MKSKLLLVNLLLCFIGFSQLPNTDIWLFNLKIKDKKTIIEKGKNITNREGYDNQPSFSEDGEKIYFVSIKADKQADIFYYHLGNKKTIQLTKTQESEYSPTLATNKSSVTSVVVQKDSSQIIQSIVFDKKEQLLKTTQISNLDSIGYFTFLNSDTIIYYKLTQPHSLRYYSISKNEDKWLGNNPIRGFKAINRHTLIYGLKDSSKVTFYTYDFVLHKSEKYTVYNSLNEDIIWNAPWGLVKSEGSKLLNFNPEKKEWNILFDLTTYGIKKITRFNFDKKNKYLVVVDNL
ncbi:MAG: hypothetical protein SFY56_15450 [Bacteroidota bacterium]|nr:hypothetical protein [Bacteroidota bacterium]